MTIKYTLNNYSFNVETFFPARIFEKITDIRVDAPEIILQQAQARQRRHHNSTNVDIEFGFHLFDARPHSLINSLARRSIASVYLKLWTPQLPSAATDSRIDLACLTLSLSLWASS